jgi:hypothetical protein
VLRADDHDFAADGFNGRAAHRSFELDVAADRIQFQALRRGVDPKVAADGPQDDILAPAAAQHDVGTDRFGFHAGLRRHAEIQICAVDAAVALAVDHPHLNALGGRREFDLFDAAAGFAAHLYFGLVPGHEFDRPRQVLDEQQAV